jgi:hypothetical protein
MTSTCLLMASWSVFKAHAAPMGMPWMWTMLFDYRLPIYGYEATREGAMAAFAKSWRRE